MSDDTEPMSYHSVNWRRRISNIALGGFSLSLVIHLLSLGGFNVSKYAPWIWVLHIGAILLVIPIFFDLLPVLSPMHQMRKFFAPLPSSARNLLISFFIYGIINFSFFFLSAWTYEGAPAIQGNRYVLVRSSSSEAQSIIREISETEYDRRTAGTLRAFSGHWMFFYLLPGLYFRYAPREK